MKRLFILPLIFLTTALAHADISYSPDESRSRPGREPEACRGYPDREFNNRMGNKLEALINHIRCSNLKAALVDLRQMETEVRLEIAKKSGTEFGECFYNDDCTDRVSQSTPTKDACDAAGGKSWKRTNPTQGKCVKL